MTLLLLFSYVNFVDPENILEVAPIDRTLAVGASGLRTVSVPANSRTRSVPSNSRTLVLN